VILPAGQPVGEFLMRQVLVERNVVFPTEVLAHLQQVHAERVVCGVFGIRYVAVGAHCFECRQ
jgi:hypothetical protein